MRKNETQVRCTDFSCKHLSDDEHCKLKKITLLWSSVPTVYDGQREFLRCNNYEESDFLKRTMQMFKDRYGENREKLK